MGALASIAKSMSLEQGSQSVQRHPEIYFKAGGELLALVALFSAILTLSIQPDVLKSGDDVRTTGGNGLLVRLGYNNVCVFWDFPPGLYVAQIGIAASVYLNLKYCLLDLRRAALHKSDLSPCVYKLNRIAPWVFGVSVCLFMMIFVITPGRGYDRDSVAMMDAVEDSTGAWVHSCFFVQYIFARGLNVLSNILEFKQTYPDYVTPLKVKIWSFTYFTGTILFPMAVIGNFIAYDVGCPVAERPCSEKQPIPAWLNMILDYSWFLCLATQHVILPAKESKMIKIEYTLVAPEDPEKGNSSETQLAAEVSGDQ